MSDPPGAPTSAGHSSTAHASVVHTLVAPALDGPVTGGTRFNTELVAALRAAGQRVDVSCGHVPASASEAWVDSLYLAQLPGWAADRPLGLITHYLPSLVRLGCRPAWAALLPLEQAALRAATAFIVPSAYLRQELLALGIDAASVGVVEPGVADDARPGPPRAPGNHVVLVANVTAGKGVAELLEALANRPLPPLELEIVGSLAMEPTYVARCRRAASDVAGDVRFSGPMPPARCLAAIRGADLLVSASRMESYGMTLAQARACGTPVVARAGGNVANLVETNAGGQLVGDVPALADAVVALLEDNDTLRARTERARAAPRRRSWNDAADDFLAAVQYFGGPGFSRCDDRRPPSATTKTNA